MQFTLLSNKVGYLNVLEVLLTLTLLVLSRSLLIVELKAVIEPKFEYHLQ